MPYFDGELNVPLAPLNVLLCGPSWVTGGHSRPTSSVIGYNWGKTWAEIMSRTSSTHPRLFFTLAAFWFVACSTQVAVHLGSCVAGV